MAIRMLMRRRAGWVGEFGSRKRMGRRTMRDVSGLRLVGWAYCSITLLVGLTALLVVVAEINTPVEARAGGSAYFAQLPD